MPAPLVPIDVPAVAVLTPANEVMAVVQMIERASKDPTVDTDKMLKLFELRERVREQAAKDAFIYSLHKLQEELPVIRMAGRIDFGKGKPMKYARWEDIYDAIKPLLVKYGLTLNFRSSDSERGIVVTAILSHLSGHVEEYPTPPLPKDVSGSKSGPQSVGSTMAYGKRYATSQALNLTWSGEDDDGNNGKHAAISQEQFEELCKMLDEAGSSKDKLAMAMGVDTLEQLPISKFEDAKKKVAAKVKK